MANITVTMRNGTTRVFTNESADRNYIYDKRLKLQGAFAVIEDFTWRVCIPAADIAEIEQDLL